MGKKDVTKPLELRYLPIEELNIDVAYQRTIAIRLVNEIIRDFSWYAFDPILVGRRKNNSLWVVDGQTRFNVARKVDHREIASRVFESEGKRHEAEVFLKANTKRSVKSFDKWRAALCAEESTTVEINTLVEKFGFSVSYSGHWPNLRCVSKLRDAHSSGVLPECLTVISKAWKNDVDALSEAIMGTLSVFFAHFTEADIDRCIVKWTSLSPRKIWADAESGKFATGGSRYRAGAYVLLNKYNAGLRTNRLDW